MIARYGLIGRRRVGASVAELIRPVGITEQTLYRWRDDFLAAGESALTHGKNGSDADTLSVVVASARNVLRA